jgi:hypothetical protein
MFPKISLTAALLLMIAPPIACASNQGGADGARMTRTAQETPVGIVVAQDGQPNVGTSDNDNDNSGDSDSNDSAGDNQNGDGNQTDQQNADGNVQPAPPQEQATPDNDNDSDPGDAQQAPQMNAYPQPVNPYQ